MRSAPSNAEYLSVLAIALIFTFLLSSVDVSVTGLAVQGPGVASATPAPTTTPDPCTGFTTCGTCQPSDSCGWCKNLNQCKHGPSSGPDDGSCSGANWAWLTGSCTTPTPTPTPTPIATHTPTPTSTPTPLPTDCDSAARWIYGNRDYATGEQRCKNGDNVENKLNCDGSAKAEGRARGFCKYNDNTQQADLCHYCGAAVATPSPTLTPTPVSTPAATPTSTVTPTPTQTPASIPPSVAFASDRDGNLEIYVTNPQGAVVRLTSNTANDNQPSISPDGTKIAFSRQISATNLNIYTVGLADRSERAVVTAPLSDSTSSQAWSPDGSKIVFVSNRDGNEEIYTINSDGSGQPTRLTTNSERDLSPVWSRQNKIAFIRASPQGGFGDIYTINPDKSELTQITTDKNFWTPAWSPDGTKLAVSKGRLGTAGCLSIINVATKAVTDLTGPGTQNGCFHDWLPTWSPDSTKLIFSKNVADAYHLYQINAGGTGLTRLTTVGRNDAPSWSLNPVPQITPTPAATPTPTLAGTTLDDLDAQTPGIQSNVRLFVGQNVVSLPLRQSELEARCNVDFFIDSQGNRLSTTEQKLLYYDPTRPAGQRFIKTNEMSLQQGTGYRIAIRDNPCDVQFTQVNAESVTITLKKGPTPQQGVQNIIFTPVEITQQRLESLCTGQIDFFVNAAGERLSNLESKFLYFDPTQPSGHRYVATNVLKPFIRIQNADYGYVGYRVAYKGSSDCVIKFRIEGTNIVPFTTTPTPAPTPTPSQLTVMVVKGPGALGRDEQTDINLVLKTNRIASCRINVDDVPHSSMAGGCDTSHSNPQTRHTCEIAGSRPEGSVLYVACKDEGGVERRSPFVIDITRPARITDLAVAAAKEGDKFKMTLTWRASGDSGFDGTAKKYHVRYLKDTQINTQNWQNAIRLEGTTYNDPPQPSAPLATETYATKNAFEPNSVYYFAVKTEDDSGNIADLSNVMRVQTGS